MVALQKDETRFAFRRPVVYWSSVAHTLEPSARGAWGLLSRNKKSAMYASPSKELCKQDRISLLKWLSMYTPSVDRLTVYQEPIIIQIAFEYSVLIG